MNNSLPRPDMISPLSPVRHPVMNNDQLMENVSMTSNLNPDVIRIFYFSKNTLSNCNNCK